MNENILDGRKCIEVFEASCFFVLIRADYHSPADTGMRGYN